MVRVPAWKDIEAKLNRGQQVASAIGGAAFLTAAISWLLGVVSSLHWSLGAVLGGGLVAAAIWLTHQVKNSPRGADPIGVIGVLALGLLTCAVVGGWASFWMHAAIPGTYDVPTRFSAGTFVDLYMFTFLDLLPAIDVPETLQLSSPIQPKTTLAGLPLLGFKLFVAWMFFDALATWRARQRGQPSTAAASRAGASPAEAAP